MFTLTIVAIPMLVLFIIIYKQDKIIKEQERKITHLHEKLMDEMWLKEFSKGGTNIA